MRHACYAQRPFHTLTALARNFGLNLGPFCPAPDESSLSSFLSFSSRSISPPPKQFSPNFVTRTAARLLDKAREIQGAWACVVFQSRPAYASVPNVLLNFMLLLQQQRRTGHPTKQAVLQRSTAEKSAGRVISVAAQPLWIFSTVKKLVLVGTTCSAVIGFPAVTVMSAATVMSFSWVGGGPKLPQVREFAQRLGALPAGGLHCYLMLASPTADIP